MKPTWFEIVCVVVGSVAATAFFTAGVLAPYPSRAVGVLIAAISLPVAILAAVGFGVSRWVREGARS